MLTAEKVATEETVGIQNPAPLRGQGNEWGMGGAKMKPAGVVLFEHSMSSSFFFLLSGVNIAISQTPYVQLCSYLVTITSLRTHTFDMTR